MTTVTIQFRRIVNESSRDSDEFLNEIEAPEVSMLPGELVNIRGEPYRIVERAWAVSPDEKLYCYVRVR